MLYVILGHDAPDALSRRLAARPAHLERLKQLQKEGRLLLAGPRPKVDAADPGAAGYHGSLIVAEFPDLAAARAWAESDPYRLQGVFNKVEVWPFVKSLPA
ncbi:MAG: YciI family protein [Gammaproteobacteria bacterium]|nr:YciI family protein [Gammaproteobacteria bacterium]